MNKQSNFRKLRLIFILGLPSFLLANSATWVMIQTEGNHHPVSCSCT
jgi:hypothetical protein